MMVQALVKLGDSTNKFLNIVKAKHGFKDKGEAIEFVVQQYAQSEREPELNSEFVKKVLEAQKQEDVVVDDFAKRYGI